MLAFVIRRKSSLVAVLLGVLCAAGGSPWALAQNSLATYTDPTTKKIIFVRNLDAASANTSTFQRATVDHYAAARDFLNKNGSIFGLKAPAKELRFLKLVKQDQLNMSHVYFEQQVKGVPVYNSGVAVHLNALGQVISASSNIVPNLRVVNRDRVSSKTAAKLAVASASRAKSAAAPVADPSAPLVIMASGLRNHSNEIVGRLSRMVRVVDEARRLDRTSFIDAETGRELDVLNNNVQYTSTRWIDDCSYQGTCHRDYYVAQYDYYFGRSEGQPARGPNPLYPGQNLLDVDDTYTVVGQIDQYLTDVLGIDGANRQGGLGAGGGEPVNTTHVQAFYGDGSWCPAGATFINWGEYTLSGQIHVCRYSAYRDLLAHEYAHGIAAHAQTPLTPNFIESGSILEAFCDIFPQVLKNYVWGWSDWILEKDWNYSYATRYPLYPDGLATDAAGGGYRQEPDRYRSGVFICDGGFMAPSVHFNSTIISHAAAMLATGKVFNDCKIEAIGADNVMKIFLRAADVYFSSGETYNGAYPKLIQACIDLFGESSPECVQTTRALQAIEIDQASPCGSPPPWQPPACRDSHPLCVDTDNGIMPFQPNRWAAFLPPNFVTIQGSPAPYTNYTFNRKSLVEYHCDGNGLGKRLVICPFSAASGACYPGRIHI